MSCQLVQLGVRSLISGEVERHEVRAKRALKAQAHKCMRAAAQRELRNTFFHDPKEITVVVKNVAFCSDVKGFDVLFQEGNGCKVWLSQDRGC